MSKTGLKWFRMDVVFDDNFELVCAEYGSKAFEVIVRLWQKVYESGYYCEWNEEVALLFARKYSLGGSAVSEITKCAVKRGLFDRQMLDRYGILTSHGIQEWYFDSVDRRKTVEIVKDYLLVDVAQKLKDVNIIYKNVSKNAENVSRNSYRQTQQTDITDRGSSAEPETPPAPREKRFVKPTLEEVTDFCLEQKLRNVKPQDFWDYYESNGWKVGKQSMKNWQAAIRRWDRNEYSPSGAARGNPGSFKDYPQRNYSKEELESLFEEAERF